MHTERAHQAARPGRNFRKLRFPRVRSLGASFSPSALPKQATEAKREGGGENKIRGIPFIFFFRSPVAHLFQAKADGAAEFSQIFCFKSHRLCQGRPGQSAWELTCLSPRGPPRAPHFCVVTRAPLLSRGPSVRGPPAGDCWGLLRAPCCRVPLRDRALQRARSRRVCVCVSVHSYASSLLAAPGAPPCPPLCSFVFPPLRGAPRVCKRLLSCLLSLCCSFSSPATPPCAQWCSFPPHHLPPSKPSFLLHSPSRPLSDENGTYLSCQMFYHIKSSGMN